jgi:hypothetical protein
MTTKSDELECKMRKRQRLACALIAAGMWSFWLAQLHAGDLKRIAEGTTQSPPAADQAKPAESKPGGTRPTTPAPEPAHPDPEAQKQGAKAALPPAPAEKIGPPIEKK